MIRKGLMLERSIELIVIFFLEFCFRGGIILSFEDEVGEF